MVDYGKWSGVEVSEDEEELARTPSLEPKSLSRFRHQRHLEEAVERRRTGQTGPPRRLHQRELSRPGFSATRLPSPSAQSQPASLESLLGQLGPTVRAWLSLTELDQSRDFLLELEHRDLCSDEGLDLVNVACVARAEEEKEGDGKELGGAGRQAALLRLLLSAAEERAACPKDAAHIQAFFRFLQGSQASSLLDQEAETLTGQFLRRARERRAAGQEPLGPAMAAEEERRRLAQAQTEVLASLPADLGRAMRAQDMAALETAAARLSADSLQDALRRCADVGLWRLSSNDQ